MTIVVFRKTKRSQPQMAVFTKSSITVDVVLDSAKRKPPIPHRWIIEDVGVGGEGLIEYYKKKYKNIKVFIDKTF
jgi:hypothetical protein